MESLGKMLIFIGIVFVLTGVAFILIKKIPFLPGKLPGDIIIKKERFTFYFPITTCIILSIVLSLLFWLIGKFLK